MSGEAVKKEKVQMDPKYILKLSITLLGICLVVSLLLGLVNGVTETQRGKKLHPGDTFTYEGKTVTVLEKK